MKTPVKKKLQKNSPEIKERYLKFVALHCVGYSKQEIISELKIGSRIYERLSELMHRNLQGDLSTKDPLKVYAEYTMRQFRIVKDLEDLQKILGGDHKKVLQNRNASTYLGLKKAQSDIFDRVIRMGLELNVLEKAQGRGGFYIDGRNTVDMDNDQVEKTLRDELNRVKRLTSDKRKKGDGKQADIVALYPDKIA